MISLFAYIPLFQLNHEFLRPSKHANFTLLQGVEDDMPKAEEPTAASSTAATAEADDDLGDPDVLADVMADPEFLKQVRVTSL